MVGQRRSNQVGTEGMVWYGMVHGLVPKLERRKKRLLSLPPDDRLKHLRHKHRQTLREFSPSMMFCLIWCLFSQVFLRELRSQAELTRRPGAGPVAKRKFPFACHRLGHQKRLSRHRPSKRSKQHVRPCSRLGHHVFASYCAGNAWPRPGRI